MNLLLSIDPGSSKYASSHTGVVLLCVPENEPAYLDSSWAVRGGLDGFREWDAQTDMLAFADIVIVETFVDRQIGGADRSPMLIEGAVRYLRPDAILSPASGIKSIISDDVLRRFDLFFEGKKDHHSDRRAAARHALKYLRGAHPPSQEFGWGWIKNDSTL